MTLRLRSIIRWSGIILIALLTGALSAPFLFKNQLIRLVKEKANANLNGRIDFNDLDISLFRHFPSWTITLEEPVVKSFVADSSVLFSAKAFSAEVDFWNLVARSEKLDIKGISLIHPKIRVISYPDGSANYQLVRDAGTNSESSLPTLSVSHYLIEEGEIFYSDSSTILNLTGLHHEGRIDLDGQRYEWDTRTDISSTDLSMSNISYLNSVSISNELKMIYDASHKSLELDRNSTRINALGLDLDGKIEWPDTQTINMDLHFKAPGNEFKELFSLVPKTFTDEFRNMSSGGSFNMEGRITGNYNSPKGIYPSWKFTCNAENGSIQYQGMPVKLDHVNLSFHTENQSDDLSEAFIRLKPLDFNLNNRPFHAGFSASNLKKDPDIEAEIRGELDLKDIKGLIPSMSGTELSGLLGAELELSANGSKIRQQQFEQMKLEGYIRCDKVKYKDTTMPAVEISEGRLDFNTRDCSLRPSRIMLGKSDLLISGNVQNPLALMDDEGTVTGNLQMQGSLMDANEWLEGSTESAPSEPSDLPALAARLDMDWKARYDLIRYADYTIKNAEAAGNYSGDRLRISNMKMNINGSDMKGNVDISPMMAFALNDKMLTGDVRIQTDYLDADQFMNTGTSQPASGSEEPFLVPEGMNVSVLFNGHRVKYDKMNLADVIADLKIVEDEIQFNELSTTAMGGKLKLTGIYNTSDPVKPSFDMKFDLNELQFPKIFESIRTFAAIAPVAQFIEGRFNSTFVFSGALDKAMNPDLGSINVNGIIETVDAAIRNYKPLEAISSKLNIKELRNLNFKNTRNYFVVENGTVKVKEINIKLNDIDVSIAGTSRIQGPMDFNFKFRIPRSKMNQIGAPGLTESGIGYLKKLAGKAGVNIETGSHINVLVNMKGALLNPDISFRLLGSDGQELGDQAKDAAGQAFDKMKDSLQKRAETEVERAKEKVSKEANRMEDSIRKAASARLEEEKNKILDKAAAEAKKQVDSNLVNKGRDILKEKAGKEVGKVLKDSSVDKIKEQMKDWNPFKKKK